MEPMGAARRETDEGKELDERRGEGVFKGTFGGLVRAKMLLMNPLMKAVEPADIPAARHVATDRHEPAAHPGATDLATDGPDWLCQGS